MSKSAAKTRTLNWISCLLFLFAAGCARSPIRSVDQAMRPANTMPSLNDDLEFASLVSGLKANVDHLRTRIPPTTTFRFGPRVLTRNEYLSAMDFLLATARQDSTGALFRQTLQKNFEPFEVYGQEDWGEVLITSYFEPSIEGSRKPTERFSQPLYGLPKDMVTMDLEAFVAVKPTLGALKDRILEQRSGANVLRGRIMPAKEPGLPVQVVPYPERSRIVGEGLKGQALELAWVDPVDAFFLEIQGSGVVRLEDGKEMTVGYAAQNGHPYVAVGKHLFDVIPKEKMSMQTIENHLRSLPRAEAQKIMNLNPSFVFFKVLPNSGLSYFGTEVVAGRTIATDHGFFPKGTLAFLEFDRPVFASTEDSEPAKWVKASRFVLDQDTGGAIRGPHRVDLFWGRGRQAKQVAGVIKNKGRLIYFVPKADFLKKVARNTP